MRRDVHKVITERPRSGRTWVSKSPRGKQVLLDTDGDQFKESSNDVRQRSVKRKHKKFRYCPRFNVVEWFLIHRLGRAWDKVYAEACMVADSRSFRGEELRQYIKDNVVTECWLEGRTPMAYDCSGCPRPVHGLYVHPRSGVLMRSNDLPA